jgi:hypothetical protein
MAQTNLKVRSGNRIIVTLDGQQIGTMKSCRMSDDYGVEPVSGIGDIHVVEYVPSLARHSLSCSTVVLNAGALRDKGIALENGDDALKGTVFDIVIMSKDDGEILRKYTGCSYASGDLEVNANAVVMANAQFNALDVSGTGG